MNAFITGVLAPIRDKTSLALSQSRRRSLVTYAPMSPPRPTKMSLAMPAAAPEDEEKLRHGTLAPGIVHVVETPEQFDALVAAAGPNGLLVADFLAKWCRKCMYLKARLPKLASEHPQVYFCTVDVNQVARLPRQYSIAKMPTFVFLRGGQVSESYVGAEDAQVVARKLRERVALHNGDSSGDSDARGTV